MLQDQHLRLADCEAKIYNGIKGFYEAGKALIVIREEELYLQSGYSGFEDYCLKKWKFSKQRAHQLMDAYKVVKELEENMTEPSTIVDEEKPNIDFKVLPFTESQARPLSKIKDPELRAKAWKEVTEENEEITAKAVENKVKEYCAPCKADPMQFRVVTYLNKKYYDKLQELMRGEQESEYLRRVVQDHCNHPKAG